MIYIEDVFRPFWASGLNNIVINNSINLNDWIREGNDYQIHNQIRGKEFELSVFDRSLFLAPISQDCNRFAISALESMIKVDDLTILPKTVSWVLIKQYYASFYAAHLILRILGYSLTQLDANTINAVQKVANLFSFRNGVSIENGYYLIDFTGSKTMLECKKINVNQDGGSHIALWKKFGDVIRTISLKILTNSTVEVQAISAKLDELVDNLDYVGSNNHSWLTRVRNEMNYKHIHGVWFPNAMNKSDIDLVKRQIGIWRTDIMTIELKNLIGKEIIRFSNTCQFIVGLANILCIDMAKRCSNGKSYLNAGHTKILNIA